MMVWKISKQYEFDDFVLCLLSSLSLKINACFHSFFLSHVTLIQINKINKNKTMEKQTSGGSNEKKLK